MAEFAKYYVSFLTNFFRNIGNFFTTRWAAWSTIFTVDVRNYVSSLSESGKSFGVLGWIVYILVTLINLTLVFFICYRLAQIIRRFVIFRGKEVEKDELLEELARTKDTVAKLTIEKNQLYALKVNNIYPGMGLVPQAGVQQISTAVAPATAGSQADGQRQAEALETRFAKLTSIDKKYEFPAPYISTVDKNNTSLKEIVDTFLNYAASQLKLYYKPHTIRTFFAGMATTKVLILEGISGTGKTSLPYALAKFFNDSATIVSVQPSWRDRADLIGYLNEFTHTYNETDFLGAIYEASYREDPSIIILDEMNLARIEYYFAEFLSIMEMPDTSEWQVDLVPKGEDGDPKRLDDGKILVPQNLWFVGTANQDDSTFTITDKVYDRTITLDLNERAPYFDAPLTESMCVPADYLDVLFTQAKRNHAISMSNMQGLKAVDEFIFDKFKVTFGNRIMKQINIFVPVYVAAGGTEAEAIDFVLQSKIFRKFNGLNLAFLSKELNDLCTFLDKTFGKGSCPLSIAYLKMLNKRG